jgi:aspartate/methionine/tyrosine aminotransferase
VIDDVRSLHTDTIRSLPIFSEPLAYYALRAEAALLERTRRFVEESLALLGALVERHRDGVEVPEPDGGTVALAYLPETDVERFCRDLALEHGLLVAPGDACFGLPGCFSVNLALQSSVWEQALPILDRAFGRLALAAGSPAPS